MATNITGGNTQVGTSNRQLIEYTTNNNGNNITINVNFNMKCTASDQHQHPEGVSISGGDLHQLMDSLKSIVSSCGQTTQIASQSAKQTVSEADIKSQHEPTTRRAQNRPNIRTVHGGSFSAIRRRLFKDQQSEPYNKTQNGPYKKQKPAVNDSVRILDSNGEVLTPGDAMWISSIYSCAIYVGDGYQIRYDKGLQSVVKEKLDMTLPFFKCIQSNCDNLDVFTPELRVQRTLQQVGKPCPVQGGVEHDFVYWTFTGSGIHKCLNSGFYLDI